MFHYNIKLPIGSFIVKYDMKKRPDDIEFMK